MGDIKVGDTVYYCYFWAHNSENFRMRNEVVAKVKDARWLYTAGDKLLCNIKDAFLSPEEAIRNLKNELQKEQDVLKAEHETGRKSMLKLIEDDGYRWLKRDKDKNEKIGILLSKLEESEVAK